MTGLPNPLHDAEALRPNGGPPSWMAPVRSLEDLAALGPEAKEAMLRDLWVHQDELERQHAELHRAHEALKESEASFRALAENNLDVIMRFDRDYRHLYTNAQSALQAGIDREAFQGRTCREMGFPTALVERWEEVLERTFATGTVQRLEFQLPTGMWIDWLCMPERDASGQVRAVMTSARDISVLKRVEGELRESKESLAHFFEHAVLGLYRTTVEGRPLLLNQALCDMLGFADFAAVVLDHQGRPEGEYEINPAYSRARFRQEIETQGCVVGLESPWMKQNGELVTLRESAWIVRDDTGRPKYFEGIFEDITASKQLEAERADLELRNRQIQKAESLGCMAAAIAHHFNNKLQAVRAGLEVLSVQRQGPTPARVMHAAKLATEQAAEVSRLMLLYLGQPSPERKPLFLTELSQNLLPLIQDALPGKVTLATSWPGPGPVVQADAEQLQEVLKGLVLNAGEALGEGGGTVGLQVTTCPAAAIPARNRFPAEWEPQEATYACLEVTDTGCGIAPRDLEKLFEPFFTTKVFGRGLGLSVIQGIVQAHGGAITVESRVGQGSAFRVYLPLATQDLPGLSGLAAPVAEPPGDDAILVVDDDPLLLELTGIMIEQLGFRVLPARDGLEALDVFRQHRAEIRCVLTDLTMPRMNGWETLTALRQLDPNLPVILSSGYDKAHVLASASPDRPQVFLGKPYGLPELEKALGHAMAVQDPGSGR